MSDVDLELAQLLCTRLCHDLAGPVGAVAAGVELIGGDPAQVDAETLGLIANSSAAASLKLKFMRTALGAAGAGGDPRTLLDGYLEAVAGLNGKPAIKWPAADLLTAASAALGSRWVQLLLNLSLLALEAQPGCRGLVLNIQTGSNLVVVVEAHGAPERASSVRAELVDAVASRASISLTAKSVHAGLAGRLIRAAGGDVAISATGNVVVVRAVFPVSGSASA